MKHTRNLDIDEELQLLQARRQKLRKLMELRKEVGELEGLTLISDNRYDTASALKIICEEVCRQFGLNMEMLGRKSREQYIAVPRMVVFYLGRQLSDISLQNMGRVFNKDHGTVIHGCKKVQDRIDTDKHFAAVLDALKVSVEDRLKAMLKEPGR